MQEMDVAAADLGQGLPMQVELGVDAPPVIGVAPGVDVVCDIRQRQTLRTIQRGTRQRHGLPLPPPGAPERVPKVVQRLLLNVQLEGSRGIVHASPLDNAWITAAAEGRLPQSYNSEPSMRRPSRLRSRDPA